MENKIKAKQVAKNAFRLPKAVQFTKYLGAPAVDVAEYINKENKRIVKSE
jgi:hypothetical protein